MFTITNTASSNNKNEIAAGLKQLQSLPFLKHCEYYLANFTFFFSNFTLRDYLHGNQWLFPCSNSNSSCQT